MSILLAIFALGALIIVHELGHFLAAKLCGVYVERFSIGFGPKLWSKTKDETEYCLSAVPLGGYVKLHRMNEEEEQIAGKENQAFFNKPYHKKIIVITAGVVFNILFAILLFSVIFMVGYKAHSPVVGSVSEGKAADLAGFLPYDKITDVNGKRVRSWEEFLSHIDRRENTEFQVGIERNGKNTVLTLRPDETNHVNPLGENEIISDAGMSVFLEPVVSGLTQGYPAEKAGIKKGDRFISINNEETREWHDVVKIIRTNRGTPLALVMQRDGTEYSINVTPLISGENENATGIIGVFSFEGNIILRDPPWTAVRRGAEKAVMMTGLMYKGIGQLLSGRVAKENIGGPILIVKETANSVQDGPDRYLSFIAFISINLAVLNLLPVPVLDGGYVLMYTYEFIVRRRISPAAQKIGQMIGFALLGAIMILAFYNDIMRFFSIM
ncbi:MAG: RIP metalloprotease RseP [Deferribacteraceae bacterium]|jgi:regulator of sigma E protease|nr:RIP metalloprotease RseP [Deferribacteraceae bacterium]